MKINYYAVTGSNAVIITTNYAQSVYCRDMFFKSPHCIHKYNAVKEATDPATYHLGGIAPFDQLIPDSLQLGKVYSVSRLDLI